MLPVKLRLHLRAHSDFFRWRNRWHGRTCTIYWEKQPRFQAAFVVGKKVVSAATDRNKVKRQLRHCVIQQSSNLPNVAMVIVAKRSGARADFADFSQDFQSCVNQLSRVS